MRDEKGPFWISRWALIRRNELTDIPPTWPIHPDYLTELSQEEFVCAFRQIHGLFYQIYSDMAEDPQAFGFPLYKVGEYGDTSREARDARAMVRSVFYLLMCLFASGDMSGDGFAADTAEVRRIRKGKKTSRLLQALENYGFHFAGIKNYRLAAAPRMEIFYPDNRNVLIVLSLAAKKSLRVQMKDAGNIYSGMWGYSCGFIGWNYKMFTEDMQTCTLSDGTDYLTDKMHSDADRDLIGAMDSILREQGFTTRRGDRNEGPGIHYFRTKGASVYDFALACCYGKLMLELRIRNADACMDYIRECPERVQDMFRSSDPGCKNRCDGTCTHAVRYIWENEEKWHCSCCAAPFKIPPVQEDIPHYLRLVELGNKR